MRSAPWASVPDAEAAYLSGGLESASLESAKSSPNDYARLRKETTAMALALNTAHVKELEELAGAVQVPRARGATGLALEDANLKARLDEVVGKEDHDITDEEAWSYRAELQAASEGRMANEKAALAIRNADLRQRIANQKSVNDADATDETMWSKREELAAASRARKLEEAKQLRQRNAETRARLRAVAPSVHRLNMDAHALRWGRALRSDER